MSWKVDHGTGVDTIYAASIALCLFGVIAPVLEFMRRAYLSNGLPSFLVTDPLAGIQVVALALAMLSTYVAIRLIKSKKKQREDEMRNLAARAVIRAFLIDLREAANDNELVELCVELSGEKDEEKKKETEEAIKARAWFYSTISPESLGHYLLLGSREQAASHLVALLTDLSPQWLLDCATTELVVTKWKEAAY